MPDVAEGSDDQTDLDLIARWKGGDERAASLLVERHASSVARFAASVGAKYAVALNSCTAALHLALEAIGLEQGDQVLVPNMTFAATAEVVRYFGATPVLVDCEAETMCIDPKQAYAAAPAGGVRARIRVLLPQAKGAQSAPEPALPRQ